MRPRNGARNQTLRDRPLNRKALNGRPAPLTVPRPAADHPEHAVERAGKRDTVTKTHFPIGPFTLDGLACRYHVVSYQVNAIFFQHSPNLLDILHIRAGNADTTLDLAVTVLNNFDLKRDTIQAENDMPAR